MKVLVLGAKGMLGQAMLDVFADHQVVGLDLGDIDITKPEQIKRVMTLYQPQAVINCAAYTNVDKCEEEETKANLVNGTAVGYLARWTATQKIPLVHISTDYVFAGLNESGYREDDPTGPPINAYGRTKLHGEEQLRLNTDRFYLVRTSWLYGPGGKNFVQTILDAAKTKPELRVVNDQHGRPTYTYDLAGFVKALLLDKAPFGNYHGTNEWATTWYDFTVEIFRQAGLTTPISPCPSSDFSRPAKRPAWSALLNTKRPLLRTWPEALRDYLRILGYAAKV